MSAVAILGRGAVTPVGLSAPASCAAMRAGVAGLGPLAPFTVPDDRNEPRPATGGRVPLEWLTGGPQPEDWPGHERFDAPLPVESHRRIADGPARLVRFATLAVGEAWASSGLPRARTAEAGLFVALASGEGEREIVAALVGTLGHGPALLDIVAQGRAAGLEALHRARAAVAAGRIAIAVVVAVDSRVRPAVLQRLWDAGALKHEDHPHGTMPGEGAAAVVLAAGVSSPLRLLASASGLEERAGTDRPIRGDGLAAVVRQTLREAAVEHRPLVVCDLDGDRYRGQEWYLAAGRTVARMRWAVPEPAPEGLWHPAEFLGDTGAASGLIDLVWAAHGLEHGYAGADQALVWGAGDGPLRAAAIIGKG